MTSVKSRPKTNTVASDIERIILVVLLAGIPFALGRYFEFNYPDPFDSAANVYSAQHILNGARIGVDEKPSAGQGTLLVNIVGVGLFGFSEFGPKMIQTIMMAGAFILMFVAMRKIFGKLPAAIGVVIACIYTSSPLIAKYGNVKEQYMIACMVSGVSLLILQQTGGKWWLGLLAGAIAAWAHLFKETGVSVVGAMGLFVIIQPVFKQRSWKQAGVDILLLLGGAAASMAPLFIWILGWHVQTSLPFYFVWDAIAGLLPKSSAGASQAGNYASQIRSVMSFAEQWPRVLRYYLALCLPISLAFGAITVGIGRMILRLRHREGLPSGKTAYDRFLLLLGAWWMLDMAFVWISPASYEQYYLPLTVSGAMTGGFLIAVWRDKLTGAVFKTKWVVTGIVGLIAMIVMSWHIYFGLSRSPYTAIKYPEKRNGYLQRWNEIAQRKQAGYRGYWEVTGQYIRDHTRPDDKIYVWGWVPGVYLSAQRFCPAPNAFESEMHTVAPGQLQQVVDGLLDSFNREMPKYIVDSRKQHLPLDRFKFELWPIVPKGFMGFQKTQFLPDDPQVVAEFEKEWGQLERERFGEDEVRRFEIMGKFRRFIMAHYDIDQMFGEQVVFKLKTK
jgi:4-amino-4-deoxy-L-arabinose transferase-like glycosyltransferase